MPRKANRLSKIFKKKKITEEKRIVISQEGSSQVDESYIRLKDNLLFRVESGLKVVQVVSSSVGEGKSTMVCNLGVSISYNNKKVAILDLDFKKPKIAKIFGIEDDLGLGDYLMGACEFGDIVNTTKYGVDVICKGKAMSNTSFALGSDKFKQLILQLREVYDVILIDSAPILSSSDYIHVAGVSDGVLIVVATNIAKKSGVRESVKELKKLSVPIIGAVMTMKTPEKNSDLDEE